MTKEEYWKKCTVDVLCLFYSNDFDIWWDPDRFDWKNKSWILTVLVPDKFDIWWDPKKFNWNFYKKYKPTINYKYDYTNNTANICKYLLYKIIIWYTSRKTNADIVGTFVNYLEWDYD